MHSFTFPLFNAFIVVLLFSHINSALTAAIAAAQPGYLPHHRQRHHHTHHHHQHLHNHISPAHITSDIKLKLNDASAVNDLENNNIGHPSMPSVSSRIFTYGKLADKFLLVNDVYLKDGWQSSLEVANAEGTGEGSLRTTIIDDDSVNANFAGPGPETGVAYHYGHDHHQGADAQDAMHHIEQRPKTTAQQPSVGVVPSGSVGHGSPSSRLALPQVKGCETLARVQHELEGGLISRVSSYASTIQKGLRRFINVYLSPLGGELRRTESSFGEEDFSILLADYLWT